MVRWIAVALLVIVAAIGWFAWQRDAAPTTAPPVGAAESPAPAPGVPAGLGQPVSTSDPGLAWTVPSGWGLAPERPVRFATYTIAGPAGGEGAECAVFHFGPDQGGSVDDNIDRWAGQFAGSPNPHRKLLHHDGVRITRVEIAGAFLSPGADMQSQGSLPGWRLLGGIAQGPHGAVFFKLTGPDAVVRGAAPAFDTLLASLRAI